MSLPIYTDADASRAADIAYHLIPSPVWDAHAGAATYEPEAYAADGFIHLTLGLDLLLNVANMFYTGDPRPYRVLVIDLSKVEAEVRYDDPERVFPHIYGLLNTDAVIGEIDVARSEDGAFTSFDIA